MLWKAGTITEPGMANSMVLSDSSLESARCLGLVRGGKRLSASRVDPAN